MNARVGRYIRMCALTPLKVLAEVMIGNENHGERAVFTDLIPNFIAQ